MTTLEFRAWVDKHRGRIARTNTDEAIIHLIALFGQDSEALQESPFPVGPARGGPHRPIVETQEEIVSTPEEIVDDDVGLTELVVPQSDSNEPE